MEKVFKRYLIPLFAILAMIVLDQWTKILTLIHVKDTDGFYIIDNVLRIYFVRNEGMAWGMLQNKQIIFIILTPIVLAALIYFYYKMPFQKKYILARVCILLLTGGAIGNLIDRVDLIDRNALIGGTFQLGNVFHGYVVDMIYAEIINFPVFNVADSFITVGFFLLIFAIIFVYKEKDFDLLFGKAKAEDDSNEEKTDSDEGESDSNKAEENSSENDSEVKEENSEQES